MLFPHFSGVHLVLGCLSLAVTTSLVWLSPLSPAAVAVGDALLGFGHPHRAAAHYDRVAHSNPLRSVQRQALRRAATVWWVELSAPAEARERLQILAMHPLHPEVHAEVLEEVAELFLEERRESDAASSFRLAHDAAPGVAGAAERLVRLAEVQASLGQRASAIDVWVEVERHYPRWGARALVGRAELHLAAGQVSEALPLFEQAVLETSQPELQAVGRLGAATCLERLGDLDEALAQLDSPAVPEGLRLRRGEGIRSSPSSRPPADRASRR